MKHKKKKKKTHQVQSGNQIQRKGRTGIAKLLLNENYGLPNTKFAHRSFYAN